VRREAVTLKSISPVSLKGEGDACCDGKVSLEVTVAIVFSPGAIPYEELPPIVVRNTLGGRLEEFRPLEPGLVRMYVCGPTVYDDTHLGHARTYVAFDAIKRYLRLRGYNVIHVQNITDIDDKIIQRASREGRSWREIAEKYAREYFSMLKALKITVDIHPRVTEHIREIIAFIERLIEKGYAYQAPSGSVYFDVDSYKDYGELSGRIHPEEWRQEEDVLREKKHPYDFALWKAWKPGEPYWESPWGRGRPGWHIECSVMSSLYLGEQFDIHGGGQDLVFPHHENEKAQSEALFGKKPWVKYWLHTGYLTISGEKMSKSLGNIVSVKEALKKWSPEILRLWLLSSHYRSQLDFNEESLEQAKLNLVRINGAFQDVLRIMREAEPEPRLNDKERKIMAMLVRAYHDFHKAMSSDFNTSKALSAVMDAVRIINRDITPLESYTLSTMAYRILKEFNTVYDVLAPQQAPVDITEDLINLLVKVRGELRKMKLYDLADSIRSDMAELGIRLLDYPGGRTVWRFERK